MSAFQRAAFLVLSLCVAASVASAQATADATAWDSVARILQTPTQSPGGYHRYTFPRRDLTLRIGGVTLAPALAQGAWAGFSGPPNDVTMMGDLVLTDAELKPALAALAHEDVTVTAIHNHLVGETPTVTYVHILARGRATDVAARLDRVLAVTATPRPVGASPAQALTVDTALVFRVLGRTGTARGNVAQVHFALVPGVVRINGQAVPSFAYGTAVNVQMVDGSRAVATGDLAIPGSALDPVLDALATHGITATAAHTHLVGESPKIYFVHFWADGPIEEVLGGLRAALDAAR